MHLLVYVVANMTPEELQLISSAVVVILSEMYQKEKHIGWTLLRLHTTIIDAVLMMLFKQTTSRASGCALAGNVVTRALSCNVAECCLVETRL